MAVRYTLALLVALSLATACDQPQQGQVRTSPDRPGVGADPDAQPPTVLPERTWSPSANRGPGGPGRNPPGTTLSYTRSNQDGTKPERVYVHVVSPVELHVAKMVERCTDAAYVTAAFDPLTRETRRLVGGRLKRDGTQDPQAFLDLDQARTLSVRFGDPKSKPVETLPAPPAPWRMYDFDLAEFALAGPTNRDFSFGLVLTWPEGPPPSLRKLGKASAQMIVSSFGGEGTGQESVFAVSGEAFGPDGGGILKLDPNRGHVIEATFSLPNHPGYEDFRLVLDSFDQDHGNEVWADALAAHWKDCPA